MCRLRWPKTSPIRRNVSAPDIAASQIRTLRTLTASPGETGFLREYSSGAWLRHNPQIRLRRFPPFRVNLLGLLIRDRGSQNHLVARLPVGWRRDAMPGGE